MDMISQFLTKIREKPVHFLTHLRQKMAIFSPKSLYIAGVAAPLGPSADLKNRERDFMADLLGRGARERSFYRAFFPGLESKHF